MADVRIYTTQTCPYCVRAKEYLRGRQVSFTDLDVTGDDAAREKLVELSGGRKTVPQIFINDTPIGGYSDMMALAASGELDRMLAR